MTQNAITAPTTADLVTLAGGEPRTSTLTIAEGLEIEHRAVIQLARTYHIDLERFGEVAFQMRLNPQGSPTEYAMLNERQTSLILTFAKNTATARAFKVRLVAEFYRMAQQLRAPVVPTDFESSLEALLIQVKTNRALTAEIQQKTQALELAQPKVEHYDKVIHFGDSLSINEAAKVLGYPPERFRFYLRNHGWIYKPYDREVPKQDKINAGHMTTKVSLYGPSARFTPAGVEAVGAQIQRVKVELPDRYALVFG